jgi:hypothetical protein
MPRTYWFYLFALLFSGFLGGMGALLGNEKADHDNAKNHEEYRLWGAAIGIVVAVVINVIVYFSIRKYLKGDGLDGHSPTSAATSRSRSSPLSLKKRSPIDEHRFLPIEDRSRTLSDREVKMLRDISRNLK